MKKNYTLLFILFFFINFSFAQSELACDGLRYIDDTFTDLKTTTVTFGSNEDAAGTTISLEMDIYEPMNDAAVKRPAIVLAFGGSFIFGQRSDMQDFCEAFARKGYVAVTIDYRLYPVVPLGFPDSIQLIDQVVKAVSDMKAAVRHLRMDAATMNTFKVDPNNIFVGGISAGSITALHTAYLDENDAFSQTIQDALDANGGIEGDTGDTNNMSYSSEVTGVLNLSGALNDADFINAGDVPVASIHGTLDSVVPYTSGIANNILYAEGSSLIHAKAEVEGVNTYLKTITGGGHTNFYTDAAYAMDVEEFYSTTYTMFHNIICPEFMVDTDDLLNVDNLVDVFPNPSNDKIQIDLSELNSDYEVRVFDQLGRMIFSSASQNDSIFILEKEKIGQGMFYVNVLFEDARIATLTKKIIFN